MVPQEVDNIIKRSRLFGYAGPTPTTGTGLTDAAMLN